MMVRVIFKKVKILALLVFLNLLLFSTSCDENVELTESEDIDLPDVSDYPIVSSGQTMFFNGLEEVSESSITESSLWFGQNANYLGTMSSYTELDNGWVVDNITGLIWTKEFPLKMTYAEAEAKRDSLNNVSDLSWRIPSCKEIYSLMNYGEGHVQGENVLVTFIDESLFDIKLGDTSSGEREIDGQLWSSTFYNGLVNNRDEGHLAPNPVDGRVKTYPTQSPMTGADNEFYLLLCTGNENYGVNNFTNNGDETITDIATSLMWAEDDGDSIFTFMQALSFAESSELAGYTDWRLPDVKELQSIVDYTRGPDSPEGLPAIDTDFFNCTPITNTNSLFENTYGYYWSNTTLSDGFETNPKVGSEGLYVCFGRALGESAGEIVDWHGAGAVRSDPKLLTGSQQGQEPIYVIEYFGPQLDERRYYNKVRLVRYAD